MCSMPKPPKIQTTPPAPPPAAAAASVNQTAPRSPDPYEGNPILMKRKGLSSLRIPLTKGGTSVPSFGPTFNGLNLPN